MADLRDTPVPLSECPFCGYKMDGALAADPADAVPEEGSLSVCISCASVLVFNADLTVRAPKPGEIEAIFRLDAPFERSVRLAQALVRSLDRKDLGR